MHISRRKREKAATACRKESAAGVTVRLARAVRLAGDSRSASTGYNKPDGMWVQKRWCPQ